MKVLRLHNKLPKHKRPWINITKHDGNRLKPTSKLYVNPTAPRCSLLPASCMRPMRNTNSYTLHKRDRYASRHKPYEKHNNVNSKQRSQLRSVRTWSMNSDVKQMNNRTSGSSYGSVKSHSNLLTGPRSMSSIPRCST